MFDELFDVRAACSWTVRSLKNQNYLSLHEECIAARLCRQLGMCTYVCVYSTCTVLARTPVYKLHSYTHVHIHIYVYIYAVGPETVVPYCRCCNTLYASDSDLAYGATHFCNGWHQVQTLHYFCIICTGRVTSLMHAQFSGLQW